MTGRTAACRSLGQCPQRAVRDLSDASQTWLNDVAALMNNRPRKTPGWKNPAEAMAHEIEAFKSTVALDVLIQALQHLFDTANEMENEGRCGCC